MNINDFYTSEPIRRKDRVLEEQETGNLVETGEYGILSTISSSGQPYGVPLSYVYAEGVLYFHCATEGEKLENIRYEPNVSFVIVGKTEVLEKSFTTKYESVIVFGMASIVEEEEEKINALMLLSKKYCSPAMEVAPLYIRKSLDRTCIVKIKIEKITGKSKK
ncbi:MAG: pyridoxamine 5'-phosphate oxidase family protein [Candidatus Azobacteroides sp.]|nr:pyridoxamine 5'-phosphate oxidase family protein [Candidatus Azobacteroides sp.]